jgi:sugar phosphate isomerase/epimerase
MKRSEIAAQLYTLRDHLKTPEDIVATLRKVRALGFEAVQVSGLGPIDPKALKEILDGEGLVCCATHEGGEAILDRTAEVIDKLNLLGCRHTAYPWPHTNPKTAADYIALAHRLTEAGQKMAKAGQVLCYHNHAIEFERMDDGRLGLEIIYEESEPLALQGEPDTYWVAAGGQDPAVWCRMLTGRIPLLHLKEYGIVDNKPIMLEVGQGNLDWTGIVAAARDSGCEWYIIEQDVCRQDPFDSLKISLEYLLALDA